MSKEVNWQAECLKKGFEYVREPDDHYVIADPSEMVALLRDLLGVDVRTKEGDSYGVAVSELQEQIDGLVNTLHAQQAELDALLAERDAQWVSSSDRVPAEDDGEVLVLMADGRCEIAWATYWHGARTDFACWTFRDPDEDRVPTHWMRLPNPPALQGEQP